MQAYSFAAPQQLASAGLHSVVQIHPSPTVPPIHMQAPVSMQAPYPQPLQATAHHLPPRPSSLTAGLPDPRAVEMQKQQYTKSLDDQLQHGEEMLKAQQKHQADYVRQSNEQSKREYCMQVDQQMKQQELDICKQYNEQLMLLQQTAQHQKWALEQQAHQLVTEYNQKKVQEEIMLQAFKMEKQQYEAQLKYHQEMQKLQVGQAQVQAQAQAQQSSFPVSHQLQQPQAAMFPLQPMGSFAPPLTPHQQYAAPVISARPASYVAPAPATMVPPPPTSYVPTMVATTV